MRIDQSPFTAKTVNPGEKPGAGRNDGGEPASLATDSVSLSNLANLISLSAHTEAADRGDRISRIATEYRGGDYRVNNAALGEALISHAFED